MIKEERSRIARSRDLQKWPAHSASQRHRHGLPAVGFAWSEQASVHLRGLPRTPRVIDVVNTALACEQVKRPNTPLADLTKNLWCNVSQCISRMPIYKSVPTCTTSMVLYSYERDRFVSSRNMLRLLGWPSNVLSSSFINAEYRFLSGNAFSVPLASICQLLAFSNPFADWWKLA